MANVLNRTTLEYLKSVNTPEYPTQDWIINPDMSLVQGVRKDYWKIVGDLVQEMNQSEKDAKIAIILPGLKTQYLNRLDQMVERVMVNRYPPQKYNMLMALKQTTQKNTVKNYIDQANDWLVNTFMTFVRDTRNTINAATTPEQLEGLGVDFNAVLAADPQITIEQALTLEGI